MKNKFKSNGTFITIGSIIVSSFVFLSCQTKQNNSNPTNSNSLGCLSGLSINTEWSNETEVPIDGYTGNAMEPKVSADQVVLFFNNKTSDDTEMDIHYAVKQPNNRYLYIGSLPGTVDNSSLDGVPAIDQNGEFYFTSLRSYTTNQQTLYSGQISVLGLNSLSVINLASADDSISLKTNGIVDMDMDVSWNGLWAIVSRATFNGQNYPSESELKMFQVSNRNLTLFASGDSQLAQINSLTDGKCRLYAPTLSDDLKELYFTILEPKTVAEDSFNFYVAVAKRTSTNLAFETPEIISAINGIVEGPTITFNDQGKTLFYHKFDSVSSTFKIYKVTRP